MNAMRNMKDSGIDWIGEIPEEWGGIRLKELFNKKQGGAWGDEAKENENDRVCIRVADFDFERQTAKEGQKTVRNYNADVISKLQIQGNELLIEKSGGGEKTPVGRSILTDGLEGDLYANFIDKLPIKAANYPKYVAYYMKTLYQNNIVIPYIKQTTGIQNLDLESLLFEIIIVPKYIEQQKIADFLDKKCAEIDKLIELQESMIEKLKEYKQSVITQAVTKGLDPDVPMKDSGIEWIGKIPEGWEVVRIKNCYKLRDEKSYEDISKVNLISLYTDLGVVQNKDIIYKTGNKAVSAEGYKKVYKDDIVVNIILCWMGAIGMSEYYGVTSPAYDVYSPLDGIYSKYYHYLFRTKEFNGQCYKYGRGIMMMRWRTYSSEFLAIPINKPPYIEQQQIADYLDKKCAEIDDLIKLKEQKIEKLKKYKKSLIYEYVTGKKEVV